MFFFVNFPLFLKKIGHKGMWDNHIQSFYYVSIMAMDFLQLLIILFAIPITSSSPFAHSINCLAISICRF